PARRVLAGPLAAPWAVDAIEAADQVVHLAGALRPVDTTYWDANVETAAALARAVRGSAVRRIVFLSYVGASVNAGNEYLRTKAEAERILAATGRELVVFRCTHIVGSPEAPGPLAQALRAPAGQVVLVPGDGTQAVAPVFVGDVVAAILGALCEGEGGTYDLAGPEAMSLNELVALVNRGEARIRHVPERLARLAALFIPSLPAALVDLMLRPALGDSSLAAGAFGIAPRSLRGLWS
ncbi:MAG TPA: NAD-dependent epimerase/dehydratase family protein, partial [Vicinamibacteria bacterium]|nr:NAD-dependent epimerase/dehydratase family protein [Vicinamibacteria bacterium]